MDNNWQELIHDFIDEAFSLLESLEDSLLILEKRTEDKNSIDTVFRVAHTIKGGAGAVGFTEITNLTHIMEDILDLVRKGQYQLTEDNISLLLNVKDTIYTMLQAYSQEQEVSVDQANILTKELEKLKLSSLTTADSKPANTPQHTLVKTSALVEKFNIDIDLLYSLQEALNNDEPIVFIEIVLNEEYELKEVGPFEILNIINSISEPIIMNPSPEMIDEAYYPFLNIAISTTESPEYIKNRVTLDEVVTEVTVTPLTKEIYQELANAIIQQDAPISLPKSTPINNSQPNNSPQDISTQQTPQQNLTLKVESSRIDSLLNLLGELVIIRSGLTQFGTNLEKSIYNMRLNLRSFMNSPELLPLHNDPNLNKERNTQFREDLNTLGTNIESYIEYIQQLTRISSTLQVHMMNLRMISIQTVFSRFTRLTRDIANQLNKKVELITLGGETEIDKSMIDALHDPLMHLIRNSLDHGIESPEERIANNKPETANIILKAYQEGDTIFIEIQDDGKGIDADIIAQKAIEKNFITQTQAESMTQQEKLSLIFLPGFSTAQQVSNISGRGVGMDVVYKTIQTFGGNVSIISKVGQGTTIQIHLPLTLAIIQGLLVLISDIHCVIPMSIVQETIIVNQSTLYKLEHYYAIEFREKLIPLISLSDILYGIPSFGPSDNKNSLNNNSNTVTEEILHQYCVIVRVGNRQLGILVPELLQEQDIVVKPLDHRLIPNYGISATTIVGNGNIGFILDIPQILSHNMKNLL